MNIITWSRNPSPKASFDSLLLDGDAWEINTSLWRAGFARWQDAPTLVIVWDGQRHAGALEAEALNGLSAFLETSWRPDTQKILLAITSAGADIHHPFESLVALNHTIESLLALKSQRNIEIDGVILPPGGTYGGASIMLATLCDTLWCDSPDDIHLLGVS